MAGLPGARGPDPAPGDVLPPAAPW